MASPHPYTTVCENLKNYSVTVVGAAKAQTPATVKRAVDAGLKDIGNNYVQEGHALRGELTRVRWHFIGNIQSRKVKDLLDYDLVQSLCRLDIASLFQTRLEPLGRSIDTLVEVNIAGEPTKAGVAPQELERFLNGLEAYPLVRVRGLMGMPPALQPPSRRAVYFEQLRGLFETFSGGGWDTLSMGTSDDYLVAAAHGSTMVRLGTVLFGARA